MFSGIIEKTVPVLGFKPRGDVWELLVQRPGEFNDIGLGDSIALNGICLTVEAVDADVIRFAVGHETLRVTSWVESLQPGQLLNVERSLRLGDRIHGHLVTGHVDVMAEVLEVVRGAESMGLRVRLPHHLQSLVWAKGSVTLNGVSLTVNEVQGADFSVWLIPETLKRTNLGTLQVGEKVCVEVDQYARYLERAREVRTN